MPLARVESKEGLATYVDNSVHLPPVFAWELPTDPLNPAAHVHAWRLHQIAQKEEQHQQTWQQRQDRAKTAAIGDRIHYYQCDHLGTPLELLDTQGEAVWSAQYKAWGGILHYERLEVEQPLRFQGQYEDAETGLYYNRHRYYDPDSARYVTLDPIGLLGGANSYQYAPNPVGWADPLGLARKEASAAIQPCNRQNAASKLIQLRGKSVPHIENILTKNGYTKTKDNGPNQTWKHSDTSEVRVHKYGNLKPTGYKSGNNAHVHKEDPCGNQVTDRGRPSLDADETQIGIRNPKDLPVVRGRPHGDGS